MQLNAGFTCLAVLDIEEKKVPDPLSGRPVLVKDDHLFFVVVSRSISYPHRLGMRLFPR